MTNILFSIAAVQSDHLGGEEVYLRLELVNEGTDTVAFTDPDPELDSPPLINVRGPQEQPSRGVKLGSNRAAGFLVLSPGERWQRAVLLPRDLFVTTGEYTATAMLSPANMAPLFSETRFHYRGYETTTINLSTWGEEQSSWAFLAWIQQVGDNWYLLQDRIRITTDFDDEIEQLGTKRITEVAPGASEPWVAQACQHPEKVVNWRFWRNGNTVYGHGPALELPPKLILPDKTGPLIGPPLEDGQHRVDLFYHVQAEPYHAGELVVARFCDPYVNPGTKPQIVASSPLPALPHTWALAIEPSGTKERRHVVCCHLSQTMQKLYIYWAILSADGILSSFEQGQLYIPPNSAVVSDSLAAVLPQPDGTALLSLALQSTEYPRVVHLVDVRLAPGSSPTLLGRSTPELATPAVAARACFGRDLRHVIWCEKDMLVVVSPTGSVAAPIRVSPLSPRTVAVLEERGYLLETSPAGPELRLLGPDTK